MSQILRVFIGIDARQPIAYHVLAHSILRRASKPVAITPLIIETLPIDRMGLTQFTYTRYLVPWLCNYEGRAVFMDADMLCLGDIAELFDVAPARGVCVAPVSRTFERVSMMFFNNASCEKLTPEYIENQTPQSIEDWADHVGVLPSEWNHTVPYDGENPSAKLIHYTQGIPIFPETQNCEYADAWHEEYESLKFTVSWEEIMGQSVHKAEMK